MISDNSNCTPYYPISQKKILFCDNTMKTLFEILPSNTDATNNTLILELGDSLVSAIIKDEDANTFSAIAVYQLERPDTKQISDVVKQLLEEKDIFNFSIKDVRIISAFHQSVLIPFSLSDKDHFSTIVDMVHGDLFSSAHVHTDLINEEGIYNAYKMPHSLTESITTKFPNLKINHLYTSLLKTISKGEDKMHLIFYPGKVIVLVVKENKFILVNSFDYFVPEDVSYLLLNLCKQLDLDKIPLEISGLIEVNSVLYKEIYKYFSVVTFASLPEDCTYPDEVTTFPAHYFSHHFANGLCE